MLNEAYKILMREDLRRDYDASIGHIRMNYGGNFSNIKGYSSWEGPLRPQALFVDESSCVGKQVHVVIALLALLIKN